MVGKVFNRFTLGFGVGYVLGARAGRERYEQLARAWRSVIGSSTVQEAAERGRAMAADVGRSVGHEIQSRMERPETIQGVMTANPRTVKATATVREAATAMRDVDAGAMVVVDDTGGVVGILTDRDIIVRGIADGGDTQSMPVSAIATMDVTTLAPGDNVRDAVRLMRKQAIRRLPVVEGGRPVGIVSIGDLAIERDSDSALADISAAPPNTESRRTGATPAKVRTTSAAGG